ncbi:zf-HC2 domain-containing protein [Actinopolymorpha sp. B11F2]|uniref:zf-HC2 domain-containing protein n=1 Tax=Actinopolymorpha sp. B11F2 TaxID=3160862 RepID=UPI0032E4234B
MSCTHAPRLGAYALGVDDPERRAIEGHLASCAHCRAELSDLAEVAAMLVTARSAGIVDAGVGEAGVGEAGVGEAGASDAAVIDMNPESEAVDDLLDRILAAIATERTDQAAKARGVHWRRRVALGIAAAVALGGSGVGVAVARGELLTPDQTQLVAGRSAYGVTATTSVRDEPWGTRIDMTLLGLPPLTSCRLVAKSHDGRTETVASWRVTYDDGLDVEGMSEFRADELAELQVIDTAGRRLVTVAATPIERPER